MELGARFAPPLEVGWQPVASRRNKKLAGISLQSARDAFQHAKGWVGLAPFDPTHMNRLEAGIYSQRFLGNPCRDA